jgi:hypothetical protein
LSRLTPGSGEFDFAGGALRRGTLSMLELLPPRHAFSNRASCEQTRAGSSSFAEVARDEDRQNSFRFGHCRRCRADARPVLAAADNGAAAGGRNLTQEQQQAGPIALPSLAPLAQHVLPAVVNISVQLNQQPALRD